MTMTSVVNTTDELLQAMRSDEITEVLVNSGQYVIPYGTVVRDASFKRVRGQGLVQLIGPLIFDGCSDFLLSNLSIRCLIEGNEARLDSLDALKLMSCNRFHIVRSSIYGGADETVAITGDSSECSISSSIIGACFHAGRNHEMALMADCDGFILQNSLLLACDRRVPQLTGNRLRTNTRGIALVGNKIETGHTMTVGIKPLAYPIGVDIVNNTFVRVSKTRCAEVAIANGSNSVAEIYLSGNRLFSDLSGDIRIDTETNGDYFVSAESPFTKEGCILSTSSSSLGPSIWDSWDTAITNELGSGKIYSDESELPTL